MITQALADRTAVHGEMALSLLLWRPDGDLPFLQAPSNIFSARADRRFPADKFCDYLCRRDRSLYRDDVQSRINAFCNDMRTWVVEEDTSALALLWIAVLRSRGQRLAFDDGVPEIACDPRNFEQWCHIAADLDPDALACLELAIAGKGAPQEQPRFDAWPLIFKTADPDLKALFSRGLSDMHLHMKSLAYTPIIWQRAHRDIRMLDEAPRYRDARSGKNRELEEERRFIENGLKRFPISTGRSLPALNDFFEKVDESTPHHICGWVARSPQEILAPYRRKLCRTWSTLIVSNPSTCGRDRLEAAFFHYLSAKILFRRHHMQHIKDSNPGLDAFDRIRKRTSHLGRFRKDEVGRHGFNKRDFVLNNALLVASLLDEGCVIRQADLRVAPPTTLPIQLAQNYAHLGKGLSRLFDRGAEGPNIGSSLHFKRNLPRDQPKEDRVRGLPESSLILRKIIEYDLETATFHLMRQRLATSSDRDLQKALRVYRRLDLASLERGSGPWLIAPFIRLLRGDRHELERLEKLPEKVPYASRWRRLLKFRQATSGAALPRLSLTCHAGEDFDTLVQGLSHIASAIDSWRMGPGDALGHCLALGGDMLDADLANKVISAGNDLDGLIWLLDYVERHNLWSLTKMHRLGNAIKGLATKIYREAASITATYIDDLAILKDKVRLADQMLNVDADLSFGRLQREHTFDQLAKLTKSPGEQLRLIDLFSHQVARRRQRLGPPDDIHRALAESGDLRDVQNHLIEEIMLRGISIETNPSSNFRMIRSQSYKDLPLIKRMSEENSMRFMICTDNPGTYDTSIAQEYSLIFGAMLSPPHSLSRDRALSLLETMRLNSELQF